MFTRKWPLHLLCLSLCLLLGPALACGPDFPMRLLDNRAQSLAELPEGSFRFEVSRLGQPIAGLKPATEATRNPDYSYDAPSSYVEQRNQAEQIGLTPPQQAVVERLRALTDVDQVAAEAANLPDELRLYAIGAAAFNVGEHQRAVEAFQQLLALPADQRRLRSTWAAYSLGRALFAVSTEAGSGDPVVLQDQARAAFRQARELSIAGFSDPLELGIASLGEEARVAYTADDWDSAIGLYAIQNLQGSPVGYSSLLQLAGDLSAQPDERLSELLKSKAVQRLVTAYLLSRVGWWDGEEPSGDKRLFELLQANARDNLDDADRLAAVSYQHGDYASAQAFVQKASDTGLAWWVRAKLALRDGDKVAAAAAYAKAAQAFPNDESWGSRRTPDWNFESVQPKCRVEGESAILALQRGDYLQAFDQLYRGQSNYWYDAAAVAERVLTVDELKQYVDAQVPAPPALSQEDRDNYVPLPVAASLRNLLGRRLLREGRFDEAPAYFDNADLQNKARAYGQLRQDAESKWWPTRRAEAYFNASWMARNWGMELLGYEMAPDYASLGGSYSLEPVELKVGPLVAEGEVQRQQASAAQPDMRYHYRFVATALASQAADHLPRTSQAFAAVLCKAVGYNSSLEEQSALYQRYVKEGPYVDWAGDFGHQCQEPDFSKANKRYVTQALDPIRSTLRPYKVWLEVSGAVLVVAVALGLISRRRRKARMSAS
ncbi:tetratricopeptide repeat protein [Pseudomonas brassicacearum]|uniref:tetratricopeptide repeat protein n=1 Tax=Pseudomonas brassicacearum TaxID=930166 RepID=UPI003D66069D